MPSPDPIAKDYAERIDAAHGRIHKFRIIADAFAQSKDSKFSGDYEYYYFEDGSELIVFDDARSNLEVDWK